MRMIERAVSDVSFEHIRFANSRKLYGHEPAAEGKKQGSPSPAHTGQHLT